MLVGVCMLTTRFAGGLRARPLESRPDRDAGIVWFVTDLHSGKEYEIESDNDVGLAFIAANANAHLSITARAEVRRDHAKAAEIWKPTDNIWWEGPDDPNVCVLRVTPLTAELWDGVGEQGRSRVRVLQGAAHRRRAEPRRVSQGYRRPALVPPAGRAMERPKNFAHAAERLGGIAAC